jgi:hypothetical protein
MMPSQSEALEGIKRAFFATLEHGAHPVLSIGGVFVVLALLTFWARREARKDRVAQEAFRTLHEAAMATAVAEGDRRAWVRVPAHVPMGVQHAGAHHRFFYEDVLTHELSARAVSFFSKAPPAPGIPLHITLDLGERWPLSLRGVVERSAAARSGVPSLVVVSLESITPTEREHLARWVAAEETLEIAEARRGRLCSRCGRPMVNGTDAMHSSCSAETSSPLLGRVPLPEFGEHDSRPKTAGG